MQKSSGKEQVRRAEPEIQGDKSLSFEKKDENIELEKNKTKWKWSQDVDKNQSREFSKKETRKSEPYKRNQEFEEKRTFSKRSSYNSDTRSNNREYHTSNKRDRRKQMEDDEEYQEYIKEFDACKGAIENIKVKEITQDLFQMSEEFSLAHCVAEDMNMGSGIAVEFRYKFKHVVELLNQRKRIGELAVLEQNDRYIYYLVTKKISSGKPTYASLFSSLKCLRKHVMERNVTKIAMPRIGCGLDRLEWTNVKFMLEFIFKNTEIEIVICNLEPTEDSSPQKHKNCKVVHETYPIQDIEKGTVIIYFSSEVEFISEEMKKLDEKFHFLIEFRHANRKIGEVVFYTKNINYLLCGCIVRKTQKDLFDYVAFAKCLSSIQKENRKYDLVYYAFQAFVDRNDSSINYKIINILRNNLRDREIYVCWPGDLINEMSPRDRFTDDRDSSFGNKNHDYNSRNRGFRSHSPQSKTFGQFRSHQQETNWRSEKKSTEIQQKTQEANSEQDENVNSCQEKQETFVASSSTSNMEEEVVQQTWDQPTTVVEDVVDVSNCGTDAEFEKWQNKWESISCTSIKEPNKIPQFYSRVCFAREDLMSYVITDSQDFSLPISRLLQQNATVGDITYTRKEAHFLYCLIVSQPYSNPSLKFLFEAVLKLSDHIRRNNIKNLFIPIQSLGKDISEQQIKSLFHFVFENLPVNLYSTPKSNKIDQKLLEKSRSIKLVHSKSALHQTKKKSIILLLSTCDGICEEMKSFSRNFPDLESHFKNQTKPLGGVITYKNGEDYVFYTCIVKSKVTEPLNFEKLQNCIEFVNQQNKVDKLASIAIQAIKTENAILNYKIITVLLNNLQNVTINVCWPGELKSLIPKIS